MVDPVFPHREVIHEGKHLRFVKQGSWEHVERTRGDLAVVIVAATDSGALLLVEQMRLPVQRRVIELPAGLVGDIHGQEQESALVAAARELEEETGYRAASLEVICTGPISPGLTTETIVLLRAKGLKRVGPGGGDASEEITVHEVPLKELETWLEGKRRDGVLVDPKVYFAALLSQAPPTT